MWIFTLVLAIVFAISGCDGKPTATSATSGGAADRDNTAVNQRDRSDAMKTPINQNENQHDIDLTANIRKRVVDANLSINGQNIKIITQDGKVTLRGPVKNAAEKTQIEGIARDVAGASNVDSQLEVEANP